MLIFPNYLPDRLTEQSEWFLGTSHCVYGFSAMRLHYYYPLFTGGETEASFTSLAQGQNGGARIRNQMSCPPLPPSLQ